MGNGNGKQTKQLWLTEKMCLFKLKALLLPSPKFSSFDFESLNGENGWWVKWHIYIYRLIDGNPKEQKREQLEL